MKETKKHVNFLIQHVHKILKFLDRQELTEGQLMIVGFLERLQYSCFHLELILDHDQEDQFDKLEFSAGLTIRPILLDAMICLNLITLLLKEEDKEATNDTKTSIIEDYAPKILSNGIKKYINFISKFKEGKHFSQEQAADYYSSVLKEYPQYFEPYKFDGSKPVLKQKSELFASTLFDNLTAREETKELSKIYNMYLYYSQYDHFSVLHFKTRNINLSRRREFLENAVLLFVNHSLTLVTMLNQLTKNDEMQKYFEIFQNYTISTIVEE